MPLQPMPFHGAKKKGKNFWLDQAPISHVGSKEKTRRGEKGYEKRYIIEFCLVGMVLASRKRISHSRRD